MIRYIFILLLLLCCLDLSAQSKINIYGYIIDKSNSQPVSNAHIKIDNKKSGSISNERGFYSINADALPCTLTISHLQYKSKTITIYTEKQLHTDILLDEKKYELTEIEITTPKPINLVKKKLYDVKDYEFIDTNIVLFAWCYKQKINPWLILMTPDGDTLVTQHINAEGTIYKDCMDSLYIVNKDSAYRINLTNNNFIISKCYTAESFLEYVDQCVTELNGTKYIKQYYYNDQVLSYYSVNVYDEKPKEFRIIADYVGLRMLVDRDRFHSMGSSQTTEADLRFEKMCFFDPIFAPLVKIDNKICIFNYVDSYIEFYDKYNTPLRKISIDFHKANNWKEDVYVDQKKTKSIHYSKKQESQHYTKSI